VILVVVYSCITLAVVLSKRYCLLNLIFSHH